MFLLLKASINQGYLEMNEKQADVERALAAFGAPLIPYRRFNNRFTAAPGEPVTVPDSPAAPIALSLLAAAPPAMSRSAFGQEGQPAGAPPGGQIQTAWQWPPAADQFARWPVVATVLPPVALHSGRTAAACQSVAETRCVAAGHLPIGDLFRTLGARPAREAPAGPPGGTELREAFRMLERIG